MHYFLLQKLSPLTQRWRLVEVAFDPTYDYLYYSAPLERADIAHYAHYHERCDESEHDTRLSPRSPGLRVRWRHKLKLTALHYAADDYAVPASSQEFKEAILLTFTVDGVERRLPSPSTATAQVTRQSSTAAPLFGASVQSTTSVIDVKARRATRDYGDTQTKRVARTKTRSAVEETARSSKSTSSQHLHSASHSQCESGSYSHSDTLRGASTGAKSTGHCSTNNHSNEDNGNDDVDAAVCAATPEYPALRLDVHTIQLSADGPAADLEDEVENVFRVNDLAPSSSSSSSSSSSEEGEEEESEEGRSTTATATEESSEEEDGDDETASGGGHDEVGARTTQRRSHGYTAGRRSARDSTLTSHHHTKQHGPQHGNCGAGTEEDGRARDAVPRAEEDDDDEGQAGESLAHRFTFGLFGRRANKPRSLTFRALSYEAFRIVSLRLRQALVRHGYCAPLHAGLPLYDPRSGIALATVPLHLRYVFRRLNDVVFYSLQCGHTVYVRHYREVRGFYGYLCITHDTILLLQEDGRCPRWLDLADITGVDYVLQGKNSFVAIRAALPCADFVFIPVFPAYPYCVDFDAEETVEGIVSMLRRLLRQRLRMHEDVSLPPPSPPQRHTKEYGTTTHTNAHERGSRSTSTDDDDDDDDGTDSDDDDRLCHIADRSQLYGDVFRYIAARGAERFMLGRGMSGKAPQHFTYKRDLVAALHRGEEEDDDDDDATEGGKDEGGRGAAAQGSRAAHAGGVTGTRQAANGLLPLQQQQQQQRVSLLTPIHEAVLPAVVPRCGGRCEGHDERSAMLSRELSSQASFTTTTVSHLLAPPSHAAELRAKDKLRLTRTDPRQRRRQQEQREEEDERQDEEGDGKSGSQGALAGASRGAAAIAMTREARHVDPDRMANVQPGSTADMSQASHVSDKRPKTDDNTNSSNSGGVVPGVVVAATDTTGAKAMVCDATHAPHACARHEQDSSHVTCRGQGGGGQRANASAANEGGAATAVPHTKAASVTDTAQAVRAARLPSPGSPTTLSSTRSKRNSYGLVPVTSPVGGDAAPGSLGGGLVAADARPETRAGAAVMTVMVVPANKGARLPLQSAVATTTARTAAAAAADAAGRSAAAGAGGAHVDRLVAPSSDDDDGEEEEDDDSFDSEDVNDLLETAH